MVSSELVSATELQENLSKRIKEAELYTRKFGSFSKSDYEILMFTAYLDSLKKTARDYEISIALGITESKVRNLRIKSQLLYPRNLEWVDELSNSITHGYYDSGSGQITITFEDPSVQNLMKNRIEESFGTVGQSLNVKQLILPIESFLLLAAYAEENTDDVIDRLNKALQKENSKKSKIEKKNLKGRFLDEVPDILSFVETVFSIYQSGRPIIESLIQKIS